MADLTRERLASIAAWAERCRKQGEWLGGPHHKGEPDYSETAVLAEMAKRGLREPDASLVPVAFVALDVPERMPGNPYEIRRVQQRDGSTRWKATDGGSPAFVVNCRGEWEVEPLPSTRSDAFIARTRFDSPGEAAAQLRRAEGISAPRAGEGPTP